MKRFIILFFALIMLCGCAKVVQKIPIDACEIPAHTETRVWYSTQKIANNTTIIPHIYHVDVPTEYRLCFRVVYDNDKTRVKWESVGKDEYDAFMEDKQP